MCKRIIPTLRSLIDRGEEWQGLLEKISKTNGRGDWNSRGLEKKLKVLIAGGRGWILNCFFRSFSNHKNYSIKNICAYSNSKMKTKVTNKQNRENFKMINRKLFIPKFCNNSKILLSFSLLIFIRALVFSFSRRANFSSFESCVFCFH